MTKSMKQYLILCFLITYIPWGILAVYTRIEQFPFTEYNWMYILYVIGVIGPALSAITLQVKQKEYTLKEAILRLIAPTKYRWDLLFVCIAVFSFDVVPFLIFGGRQTASLINLVFYIPIFLIIGGLEEVGWRGYWLEHILTETNWSGFKSSVVIGVVWTVWHLPLFAMMGTYQQQYLNIGIFALWTFGFSFLQTGIYLLRRNVLLCVVTHCIMNSVGELFVANISWIEGMTKLLIGVMLFYFLQFMKKKSESTLKK